MEKRKNYALISAILFSVCTLCFLYMSVETLMTTEVGSDNTNLLSSVLFLIASTVITVALFFKSKKWCIVGAALEIAYYILGSIYTHSFTNMFLSVAYAVLIFFFAQSLRKREPIIKMIWFIPSLLMLLYLLLYTTEFIGECMRYAEFQTLYETHGVYFNYFRIIAQFASCIFETAALFFIGKWLKASTPAPVKKNIPLTGGADKLREYKELLDRGLISKEEFEEKKQQILNFKL